MSSPHGTEPLVAPNSCSPSYKGRRSSSEQISNYTSLSPRLLAQHNAIRLGRGRRRGRLARKKNLFMPRISSPPHRTRIICCCGVTWASKAGVHRRRSANRRRSLFSFLCFSKTSAVSSRRHLERQGRRCAGILNQGIESQAGRRQSWRRQAEPVLTPCIRAMGFCPRTLPSPKQCLMRVWPG